MIQKIILTAGVFFLLCAAVPSLIYGIANAGVISLAAAGLAIVFAPKYWGKLMAFKPLRVALPVVLAAGCGFVAVVSAMMIGSAYFNKPPETGEVGVIVLGGGIREDRPSLMLRKRLDVARGYMLENTGAYCIVTGNQGPDETMPESVVMKNYLVSMGIAPERIIIEDKSTNTRENLKFASELMPDKKAPVVIVTDGFHQLRANFYAREAELTAYGLSSVTPWGLLPAYWVREMLGLAAAWLLSK